MGFNWSILAEKKGSTFIEAAILFPLIIGIMIVFFLSMCRLYETGTKSVTQHFKQTEVFAYEFSESEELIKLQVIEEFIKGEKTKDEGKK